MIAFFDRDTERCSVRHDGEARIIQAMDIKAIVAICRCRRARAYTFFVDPFVVLFCRSVRESEIFKKINEGGLPLICGDIDEVIFVLLSEPEDLFQKQFTELKAASFRPNLERADLQYLIGFFHGVGVRARFILSDEKAGNSVVFDNPAEAPLLHAFFCPPFIKTWIVLAQTVKDSVRQRYRMSGDLIDETHRRFDWLIIVARRLVHENIDLVLGSEACQCRKSRLYCFIVFQMDNYIRVNQVSLCAHSGAPFEARASHRGKTAEL
ncbi:No hit [Brucella canis HSK A52141]|nr:No hit [Brucella canis HSK A52141]